MPHCRVSALVKRQAPSGHAKTHDSVIARRSWSGPGPPVGACHWLRRCCNVPFTYLGRLGKNPVLKRTYPTPSIRLAVGAG